jgi:hypothetical protein
MIKMLIENQVYLKKKSKFYSKFPFENLPKISNRIGYGKCLLVQCFIP